MIVQDKQKELCYFGAVQFNREQADKSLAMYPGVKRTNLFAFFDNAKDVEPLLLSIATDWTRPMYSLNGRPVFDGEWLVTDLNGETKIYSDEKFKSIFIGKDGDEL